MQFQPQEKTFENKKYKNKVIMKQKNKRNIYFYLSILFLIIYFLFLILFFNFNNLKNSLGNGIFTVICFITTFTLFLTLSIFFVVKSAKRIYKTKEAQSKQKIMNLLMLIVSIVFLILSIIWTYDVINYAILNNNAWLSENLWANTIISYAHVWFGYKTFYVNGFESLGRSSIPFFVYLLLSIISILLIINNYIISNYLQIPKIQKN